MRKILWLITLVAILHSFNSTGQLSNLKNLKDKVASGKSEKNKSDDNATASNSSSNSQTEKTTVLSNGDMENGKGYFYTSFTPKGFKTEVNIGEELYVRMNMGKTMIELAQEKGVNCDYTAYGFITVYIDNNKSFVAGPYSFASNFSKKWLYIDIPLNVKPDFVEKIAADQSMIATDQDIWVFQQLFQENSIMKQYTTTAMKSMTSGNHTVKVEFGLGESDSKEPKAVICSGIVKVISDEAGSKALAMNGPKNLRPLSDNEKGKIICNAQPFTAGVSELTAKIELPKPIKYYNMKWCKASSCDYDHGNVEFYVSIDNEPVATWSTQLWDADYSSATSFSFVVLPKNDAGIGAVEAEFNKSKLFKSENPVVYSLLDKIYSGNLKTGKHQLKIKAYSQECVPFNVDYEFIDSYFSQWPAIAETVIEFNVTDDGRNAMINSSSAKKLGHATGDWVAVDNKLKSSNANVPDYQVIDIATQTEWKIVKNSLGAILYRECKADVIYKSKYGCRLQKRLAVKEDYNGGGYSSPYLVDRIEFSFGSSLLNSMHLPVPESKVK